MNVAFTIRHTSKALSHWSTFFFSTSYRRTEIFRTFQRTLFVAIVIAIVSQFFHHSNAIHSWYIFVVWLFCCYFSSVQRILLSRISMRAHAFRSYLSLPKLWAQHFCFEGQWWRMKCMLVCFSVWECVYIRRAKPPETQLEMTPSQWTQIHYELIRSLNMNNCACILLIIEQVVNITSYETSPSARIWKNVWIMFLPLMLLECFNV